MFLASFFDSLHKGFDKNEIFDVVKNENNVELLFKAQYRKKIKVKSAFLTFSDKSYNLAKIQKMTLVYDNEEKGDFNIIKYEQAVVDKKTFEFTPPPNTKISN